MAPTWASQVEDRADDQINGLKGQASGSVGRASFGWIPMNGAVHHRQAQDDFKEAAPGKRRSLESGLNVSDGVEVPTSKSWDASQLVAGVQWLPVGQTKFYLASLTAAQKRRQVSDGTGEEAIEPDNSFIIGTSQVAVECWMSLTIVGGEFLATAAAAATAANSRRFSSETSEGVVLSIQVTMATIWAASNNENNNENRNCIHSQPLRHWAGWPLPAPPASGLVGSGLAGGRALWRPQPLPPLYGRQFSSNQLTTVDGGIDPACTQSWRRCQCCYANATPAPTTSLVLSGNLSGSADNLASLPIGGWTGGYSKPPLPIGLAAAHDERSGSFGGLAAGKSILQLMAFKVCQRASSPGSQQQQRQRSNWKATQLAFADAGWGKRGPVGLETSRIIIIATAAAAAAAQPSSTFSGKCLNTHHCVPCFCCGYSYRGEEISIRPLRRLHRAVFTALWKPLSQPYHYERWRCGAGPSGPRTTSENRANKPHRQYLYLHAWPPIDPTSSANYCSLVLFATDSSHRSSSERRPPPPPSAEQPVLACQPARQLACCRLLAIQLASLAEPRMELNVYEASSKCFLSGFPWSTWTQQQQQQRESPGDADYYGRHQLGPDLNQAAASNSTSRRHVLQARQPPSGCLVAATAASSSSTRNSSDDGRTHCDEWSRPPLKAGHPHPSASSAKKILIIHENGGSESSHFIAISEHSYDHLNTTSERKPEPELGPKLARELELELAPNEAASRTSNALADSGSIREDPGTRASRTAVVGAAKRVGKLGGDHLAFEFELESEAELELELELESQLRAALGGLILMLSSWLYVRCCCCCYWLVERKLAQANIKEPPRPTHNESVPTEPVRGTLRNRSSTNPMIDHHSEPSDKSRELVAISRPPPPSHYSPPTGQLKQPASGQRGPKLALNRVCRLSVNQQLSRHFYLLFGWLLLICSLQLTATLSSGGGGSPPKLEFWRQLARASLSDVSQGREAAVDRLALKMATWPDQRRAALFYLDLVQRRRDRQLLLDEGAGGPVEWCQRSSFAELTAKSPSWPTDSTLDQPSSHDQSDRVGLQQQSTLRRLASKRWSPPKEELVRLNELGSNANWPVGVEASRLSSESAGELPRGLLELSPSSSSGVLNRRSSANASSGRRQINEHPKLVESAKLAVENANLINRLLIHLENEPIKSIGSSERFFKYLLESKLRQFASSEPALYSVGVIFFATSSFSSAAAATAASSPPAPQALKQSSRIAHPATQKKRRINSNKKQRSASSAPQLGDQQGRRQQSQWTQSGNDDPSPDSGGSHSSSLSPALEPEQRVLFAPMAFVATRKPLIKVRLTDLSSHQVAANGSSANGYFGPVGWQPFYARWLTSGMSGAVPQSRAEPSAGFSAQHEAPSDAAAAAEADLKHGRWFSPYLDCGLSNKWLLTYSIPINPINNVSLAGSHDDYDNQLDEIRGVSYVSLDLAKTGLIDQCADEELEVEGSGAFLANTHQCAKLGRSQCLKVPDFEEVRSGAYVCLCPPGGSVAPEERQATSERRDRLVGLLAKAASLNSSHSLDQLSLELDERLADRRFVSERLFPELAREPVPKWHPNHPTTSSSSSHSMDYRHRVAAANRQQLVAAAANMRSRHFALGVQLESDAALQWLASEIQTDEAYSSSLSSFEQARLNHAKLAEPGWPDQVCRLCRPQSPVQQATAVTGAQLAASLDETNNSNTTNNKLGGALSFPAAQDNAAGSDLRFADAEQSQRLNLASMLASATTCSELPELLERANWIREFVLALQSGCVIAALALIGILFKCRKSRIILVSGWLMLETTLVGALILYSSVFVRYFEPTSITCLLEPWLRELGFSIFYGSILIKLYRILTEFQTRKAHRVCFRDKDQIMYLLAIVLIVVGYMSAWTALMVDGFFFGRSQKMLNVQQAPSPSPTTHFNTDQQRFLQKRHHFEPSRLETSSSSSGGSGSGSVGGGGGSSSRYARTLMAALKRDSQAEMEHLFNEKPQRAPATRDEQLTSSVANNSFSMAAALSRQQHSLLNYSIVDAAAAAPGNYEIGSSSSPSPSSSSSSLTSSDTISRQRQQVFEPSSLKLSEHFLRNTQEELVDDSSTRLDQLDDQTEPTSTAQTWKSAIDQLSVYTQLEVLLKNLNSFSDLFSGLLETERLYDETSQSLTYSMRCRKLTWDYVTELSEIGLLLFGIYLIYKLRNAGSDAHKEKLVLSAAVFIELLISTLAYIIRHTFWQQLSSDQLLVLYCARCQLTVTLTVALVFGPKLWTIAKSKPTTFFGSSSDSSRTTSGSIRHRCHLTCELHDHHLNDAMRLHQAMLSNGALDIGSINLADMDPDEIQAELKRVYAQLEVLKTKAMRRDNPHISKRRGGRKTGHRKFSLQAFHAKHIGGHHSSSNNNNNNNNLQQQQNQQQQESLPAGSSDKSNLVVSSQKLPVLVEQDTTRGSACEQSTTSDLLCPSDQAGLFSDCSSTRRSSANERRVRVDEQPSFNPLQADRLAQCSSSRQNQVRLAHSSHNHSHNHHQHHHNHHSQQQQQQQQQQSLGYKQTSQRRSIILADPVSTSSTGGVFFDDDTYTHNDSQSSGNVSPHRQSSFVCSQSSIHREDSSTANY